MKNQTRPREHEEKKTTKHPHSYTRVRVCIEWVNCLLKRNESSSLIRMTVIYMTQRENHLTAEWDGGRSVLWLERGPDKSAGSDVTFAGAEPKGASRRTVPVRFGTSLTNLTGWEQNVAVVRSSEGTFRPPSTDFPGPFERRTPPGRTRRV